MSKIFYDLINDSAVIIGNSYEQEFEFNEVVTAKTITAKILQKSDLTDVVSFTVTKSITNTKRFTISLTTVQTASLSSYINKDVIYKIDIDSVTYLSGKQELKKI